jgi:hypothetical protein
MSTAIRTATVSDKTLYNANDVYTSIGVSWNGKDSLRNMKEGFHFKKVKAPLKKTDGTVSKTEFYALTDKGVNKLCKTFKKANPLNTVTIKDTAQDKTNKEVQELRNQVAALKQAFAKALFANAQPVNANNAPVINKPKDERDEIRQIVTTFASNYAKNNGITNPQDARIYFDLCFNMLYNTYKQKYNFDIKSAAGKQNITGLAIAQQYGLLPNLLNVAKDLFV